MGGAHFMSTAMILLIVVAVVVVAAILIYAQKEKSKALRTKFGPEYDRLMENSDRRRAESELEQRQKRVEKFHVHPLSRELKTEFAESWRKEQARFVDDPKGSVSRADALVLQVMKARGYPMSEFDQRAADISVDHPQVVEHYRAAHEIALRAERGQTNTEDLRNALIHYRALFEDLLETKVVEQNTEHTEVRR
jgi:Ni/Co efflux regulator RcnB